MISTASVATVPMIHNALTWIVSTNVRIASAFAGAVPVTPAARRAHACANTNPANTAPPTTAATRRYPAATDITDLPGPLDRRFNTAGTPRTNPHPPTAAAAGRWSSDWDRQPDRWQEQA